MVKCNNCPVDLFVATDHATCASEHSIAFKQSVIQGDATLTLMVLRSHPHPVDNVNSCFFFLSQFPVAKLQIA